MYIEAAYICPWLTSTPSRFRASTRIATSLAFPHPESSIFLVTSSHDSAAKSIIQVDSTSKPPGGSQTHPSMPSTSRHHAFCGRMPGKLGDPLACPRSSKQLSCRRKPVSTQPLICRRIFYRDEACTCSLLSLGAAVFPDPVNLGDWRCPAARPPPAMRSFNMTAAQYSRDETTF